MEDSSPLLASLGVVPPERWRLKGEGAANWVFCLDRESARESRHLDGMVLRVRKPRPAPLPEQAALEAAVWDAVLGDIASTAEAAAEDGGSSAAVALAAMCREQRYVQRVMVRLLGQQHVPRAQPVAAPPGYLEKVLAANGLHPGGDGRSSAAAGVRAAALLPDVTLLASSGSSGSRGPHGLSGGGGAAAAEGAGPVVCLELKPKCGFVGRCATVHPDNRHIKRSNSRYQLHQMLKLSQGKIAACSPYDPRDLFSGRPARVREALRALLAHPQNNLRLFVDGQPRQLAPAATASIEQQQAEKHVQDRLQALQQAGKTNTQQQQQQQHQAEQQHAERRAGKTLGIDEDASLAGLLPLLPAGQQRDALIELLAVALEAEGVLQRLLQAQSQCQYDIEGIYRLYCRLTGLTVGAAAEAEAAAAPAAATVEAAAVDGLQGSSTSLCDTEQEPLDGEGGEEGHSAAMRRLLALPEAEAHAVLRSYVASATAKDCALMIALQRCQQPPPPPQQQQQQVGSRDCPAVGACQGCSNASAANGKASHKVHNTSGSSDGGSGSGGGGQLPCRAKAVQAQVDGEPGVLRLLPCGLLFRYRISFVDLDIKPLAKIPAHHALDQRIVAAARAHLRGQPGD